MLAITELRRLERIGNKTLGAFFLNGDIICQTLEDTDRDLKETMSIDQIKAVKVYGKTAIPTGDYSVIFQYSPKFKMVLPTVLDVPGFENIRIHYGNNETDTLGCILVGEYFKNDVLLNSKKALDNIINKIKGYERIQLKVTQSFMAKTNT